MFRSGRFAANGGSLRRFRNSRGRIWATALMRTGPSSPAKDVFDSRSVRISRKVRSKTSPAEARTGPASAAILTAMSKTAYVQPFSGASGDMLLGALVDAGLSPDALTEGLASLGVKGWSLEVTRVLRGPFESTRLKVLLDTPAGATRESAYDGHSHSHSHSHTHGHHSHSHTHTHLDTQDGEPEEGDSAVGDNGLPHAHTHKHSHTHEHTHSTSGSPAGVDDVLARRNLTEILRLIDASELPPPVKANAAAVFQRLGEAEAKVHGMPIEEVHFHEVGAVDSIVDIVGTCLGFHLLGVERLYSAPITVGTGYVRGDHGTMPLPAPATLELLRGFPIEHRDSRAELTTPTGAAVLTTLVDEFSTMPPLVVGEIGYGAGDDRPGAVPNVLRITLGETQPVGGAPTGARRDRIVVLETQIDDMTSEWLANLMDQLFAAEALDVTYTPVLMKKGRPGHELRVLVPLAKEGAVLQTLFRESTTFGVRRAESDRIILDRRTATVECPWGNVRVKEGLLGDEVVTASPEFADLDAAARTSRVPLKELHAQVMEAYRAKRE